MVIDDGNGRGKLRHEPLTGARVIGAVDEDCGAICRQLERVGGAQKCHSPDQKLEPAWDGIRVDAHDVVTAASEHECECNLGADAVTIRPGVADNGDLAISEAREQPSELDGKLGIKFFHHHDGSGKLFPSPGSVGDAGTISSSNRCRRVPCPVDLARRYSNFGRNFRTMRRPISWRISGALDRSQRSFCVAVSSSPTIETNTRASRKSGETRTSKIVRAMVSLW